MHQSTLRANLNEKFDTVKKTTTATKKGNPEASQFEIRAFHSNTYFSAARRWHFELLENYPKIVFWKLYVMCQILYDSKLGLGWFLIDIEGIYPFHNMLALFIDPNIYLNRPSTYCAHQSKSKLKKTGIGQVPVFPLHSASLEEKLNEISNR